MRRLWSVGWLLAAGAWLLLAAGCGGQQASVAGTVTLDGQPLTTGAVVFHPVGEGPLAYGQIDSAGKYALQSGGQSGLQPGEYLVTVSATTMPSTVGTQEQPGKLLTPERYGDKARTDLRFTVKPGRNQID